MWRASIPACSGDREFFRDQYLAGTSVDVSRLAHPDLADRDQRWSRGGRRYVSLNRGGRCANVAVVHEAQKSCPSS